MKKTSSYNSFCLSSSSQVGIYGVNSPINALDFILYSNDVINSSVNFKFSSSFSNSSYYQNSNNLGVNRACLLVNGGLLVGPFISSSSTFFKDTNSFFGLKFEISGNTHYGWIRATRVGRTLKFIDYAYNSCPDNMILAGDTVDSACLRDQTFSNCDSLNYKGTEFYNDTLFYDTLFNFSSTTFDSIINVNIEINSNVIDYQTIQGCNSYSYNSQIYTSSTILYDTLFGASSAGCDSIRVVNLNIGQDNYNYIDTLICTGPFYYNSAIHYVSDTIVTEWVTNSTGCLDYTAFNLTIKGTSQTFIDTTLDDGEFVLVGNQVYDSSGVYNIYLTTINGCDSVVNLNIFMNTISSIDDILNNNNLSILPNPFTNSLSVSILNNKIDYTINMYNLIGERVYSSITNQNTHQLNLEDLPSEVYIVEIIIGDEVFRSKVIKE